MIGSFCLLERWPFLHPPERIVSMKPVFIHPGMGARETDQRAFATFPAFQSGTDSAVVRRLVNVSETANPPAHG